MFHRAIRLHGIENFEYTVVATYEHETEQGLYDLLNEAEIERIKFRNSLAPNGYNVAPGGENGNYLAGYTQEQYDDWCIKNRERTKISMNRYVNEHPEWNERQSVIQKTRLENPDEREKCRQGQFKRYNGENGDIEREKSRQRALIALNKPDTKQRMRNSQQKRFEDPKQHEWASERNYKRYNGENGDIEREKTAKAAKISQNKPEVKEKKSKSVKKSWENEEIRDKRIEGIKKSHSNPDVRKKCGKANKGKKLMHIENYQEYVPVDEIEQRKKEGWELGACDEFKKMRSEMAKIQMQKKSA